MEKKAKIFVAGHNGLVGSSIVRKLLSEGYENILFRNSKELDLRNSYLVSDFFKTVKPEYVFFAAGTVGGIMANIKYPADFIYNNLSMIVNVINASYYSNVKKLLYLGSSCIYPKNAVQPIKEEYLLTGELEATNKPYAIAKIAGIELCHSFNRQYGTDYISLVPTNMFGIGDNYDLERSHLVAALIRKIHEGKINNKSRIKLWGTGRVLREVLCSDELANACLFFMRNYSGSDIINIGSGQDHTVSHLAKIIQDIVDYKGGIDFDSSKPDGMFRKQLDVSKASRLGWNAKNNLVEDLRRTYDDFVLNYKNYITD